jgi:hypothetical protein
MFSTRAHNFLVQTTYIDVSFLNKKKANMSTQPVFFYATSTLVSFDMETNNCNCTSEDINPNQTKTEEHSFLKYKTNT